MLVSQATIKTAPTVPTTGGAVVGNMMIGLELPVSSETSPALAQGDL